MRSFMVAIVALALASPMAAQAPAAEARVRQTVQAFYAAFNSHGFDRAAEFTTDDWNHINPLGGRTRGREAVLKELRAVHSTFLRHVSDTIEQMDVPFASRYGRRPVARRALPDSSFEELRLLWPLCVKALTNVNFYVRLPTCHSPTGPGY